MATDKTEDRHIPGKTKTAQCARCCREKPIEELTLIHFPRAGGHLATKIVCANKNTCGARQ